MPGPLNHGDLVTDLSGARAKGIDRFPELAVPTLRASIAKITGHDPDQLRPDHLAAALQAALDAMGDGDATDCAAALFGVAPEHRGLHPRELRKRGAEIISGRTDPAAVDAFRKTGEPRVLAALATALLAIADGTAPTPAAAGPGPTRPAVLFPMTRLVIDLDRWRARSLPVLAIEPHRPGHLRELTWAEFGAGIEVLQSQIHHYGTNLDIDLAIGMNEAGLLMATLLASASFNRCAIGYIRTRSRGTSLRIDEEHSLLGPQLQTATAVLVCDYEVKTSRVLTQVLEHLTAAGLPPATPRYFAVMGALATEARSLDALGDLDVAVAVAASQLACRPVLQAAQLADAFIAGLMASPGIDPPLGLR